MSKAGQISKRVFFVLYLFAVHALAIFFVFERWIIPHIRTDDSFTAGVNSPTLETPAPTPIDVPDIVNENTGTANANVNVSTNANLNSYANQNAGPSGLPNSSGQLMIPVAGIKRQQLLDTFTSSRANNRLHDAIDIIAPAGTPVVATADGEIAKFFDSEPGGITIYQYSADKKMIYYYAHLQKRAENIKETDYVRQGTVIGYVGDTGNAGPGNNHLHFSIAELRDPKRYWEGNYINPFPLLAGGLEAR
jgi:peptidoglycan LD-endopeptidase LytH